MSIFPKRLIRGQDSYTTFHMNICNSSNEDIEGKIKYKVIRPDGMFDILEFDRIEKIEAESEINKYDKYYIKKDYPIGRYYVKGLFLWNGEEILSDTNDIDFFDVEV